MNTGSNIITVTPVISTSPAYTAGDLVGTKMNFGTSLLDYNNPFLQAISIVDQNKQSAAFHIIVFDSDPTATTFTDNAALNVADADMSKIIGAVSLTFYSALSSNSYGFVGGLALPMENRGGTLFAALVIQGAATYAATNDIIVNFHVVGY